MCRQLFWSAVGKYLLVSNGWSLKWNTKILQNSPWNCTSWYLGMKVPFRNIILQGFLWATIFSTSQNYFLPCKKSLGERHCSKWLSLCCYGVFLGHQVKPGPFLTSTGCNEDWYCLSEDGLAVKKAVEISPLVLHYKYFIICLSDLFCE